MTRSATDYARQLRAWNVSADAVAQCRELLDSVPSIADLLEDPTLALERKYAAIDRIFPVEIRDFLKLLCEKGDISGFGGICDAFRLESQRAQGKLPVLLSYVTPPTAQQREGIRHFLARKYPDQELAFEEREDPSLVSGFLIRAGNEEFDWSAEGRLRQLRQKFQDVPASPSMEGIISILKSTVEEFDLTADRQEIGTVVSVGDGVAVIDGVDHACYGEILLFDSGEKGMVQDIRRDRIGCILFGGDADIREGSRVVRTGKRAGVPVGSGILGRVVNALGEPIDGGGAIDATDYRPIEHKAPGVIARQGIDQPLETGILSIDSMFPIGRGQRELIIGDRQTGKTALAVDTIINQKGKDVICIYVAIGQKASTVAQIVNTLRKYHAMDYSVVLSSPASDPATLQYIAPYAGAAIGEHFMDQGKDVLIVYDDLSKHAQAYRAISLLLLRPPGREAYPGDVFYLHSRLLERACRRSSAFGGGSMTALPIIETQAGDVSAYIPTNVISITDGQIFLESELFHSGQRPAVNVGLSVSRVGGKAQTKAMKAASGTLRIDLAQYREMEAFTQFSSDLDEVTRDMLDYGKSLYALLKQPLYHPMPLAKQVVLLCAANARLLSHVPEDQMQDFKDGVYQFISDEHPGILAELTSGKLTDELKERILAAVRAYQSR